MNGLRNMLIQERDRLKNLISRAEAEKQELPEGRLRMTHNRGKVRYYHCLNGIESYISKQDKELPCQLAQRAYDISVAKKARKRYEQIVTLLNDYSDDEIEQIYLSANKERRDLITPHEIPIDQQIKNWLEQPYQVKSFQEGTVVILSERGERVRSKSEKILADYFYRNNIPYLYEKPLHLDGYGVVYPDFTIFSKRLGGEVYWEHEGMMDKPDYAKMAVKKMNLYQKHGIFPGERLILTFETEQEVLSTRIIETLVVKYLDPS